MRETTPGQVVGSVPATASRDRGQHEHPSVGQAHRALRLVDRELQAPLVQVLLDDLDERLLAGDAERGRDPGRQGGGDGRAGEAAAVAAVASPEPEPPLPHATSTIEPARPSARTGAAWRRGRRPEGEGACTPSGPVRTR